MNKNIIGASEHTLSVSKPPQDIFAPAARSALPLGQEINGRYHLVRLLGRGGMGSVYIASDSRLKREVALKIVHPHIAVDPELRRMFVREAESMAQLRHPNVIEIYDIGEMGSCPYLVMPHLRAIDMVRWAGRRGGPPLPPDLVVGLLGQACAGVAAMHAKGLIHGDIKPRNLLVSESFEVVVADLGLARSAPHLHRHDTLSGTPGYIAPELIVGEGKPSLASKVDVYSLGVTGYWLLVGRTPAGPGDTEEVFDRQLGGTIIPPSELRPELPAAIDAPLMAAIDRDPTRRPDVLDFREAMFAARDHARRAQPARHPFVVVIDDDPDMLAMVREAITDAVDDIELVALQDPVAALSLIESRPPDLVITDLQMPRLNGVELTAAMKGRPATREVPVLVMTGEGGAADWKLLYELGASRFLVKPFNTEMLLELALPLLPRRGHQ